MFKETIMTSHFEISRIKNDLIVYLDIPIGKNWGLYEFKNHKLIRKTIWKFD